MVLAGLLALPVLELTASLCELILDLLRSVCLLGLIFDKLTHGFLDSFEVGAKLFHLLRMELFVAIFADTLH